MLTVCGLQCDAARPFCSRCVTSRRICGGYDHGTSSDLLFKNQTIVAIREKVARQGSTRTKRGKKPNSASW